MLSFDVPCPPLGAASQVAGAREGDAVLYVDTDTDLDAILLATVSFLPSAFRSLTSGGNAPQCARLAVSAVDRFDVRRAGLVRAAHVPTAASVSLHAAALDALPVPARAALAADLVFVIDGWVVAGGARLTVPWSCGQLLTLEVVRASPMSSTAPQLARIKAGATTLSIVTAAQRAATAASPRSPWKNGARIDYARSPPRDVAVSPASATSPSPGATPRAPSTIPRPPMPTASTALPGLERVAATLLEALAWPILAAPFFAEMRLAPQKAILLHGPPGCGKTALVRALVEDARCALTPKPVALFEPDTRASGMPIHGVAEGALRDVFSRAQSFAALGGAAVVFLDEVDALVPARSGSRGDTRSSLQSVRIVTQLLTLLDGTCDRSASRSSGTVLVIGATNRPAALDGALRRPGRFDIEVLVPPPDAHARLRILQHLLASVPLESAAFAALPTLAQDLVGFVGADIVATVRDAATSALLRAKRAAVSLGDLSASARRIGASALRGAAGLIPESPHRVDSSSAWARIGGMDAAIARLRSAVEAPIRNEALYARFGLRAPRGLLLHGPPGNSKTTLARALGVALGAPIFALRPSDVLSAYVGEAERALREVFARARAAAPSIVFLDEIDALVCARNGSDSGSSLARSLLATLLTELDGVGDAGRVLVIGATNRVAALDAALLRPGRLELHIAVPSPDEAGRTAVLHIYASALPLATCVDLAAVARATVGWSGARLEALCRNAALVTLRERIQSGCDAAAPVSVTRAHFESALKATT
jgi:SpoVK/Ycf46/Vps4 family AAA+-type ATPase